MKQIQEKGTIIKRQTCASLLHCVRRRAFLILCAAALTICETGCLPFLIASAGTHKFTVDPEFAKTHDLNFNEPSAKTKAVLLFNLTGRTFPPRWVGEDSFRKAFLESMKETGAFSEIACANKEKDLRK